MKEQLVPFLKSLVWLGRGSNPQYPGHKAHALPTKPLCWSKPDKTQAAFSPHVQNIIIFTFFMYKIIVLLNYVLYYSQALYLTDNVSSTSSHPFGSILNIRCVSLKSRLLLISSADIFHGFSSVSVGSSLACKKKKVILFFSQVGWIVAHMFLGTSCNWFPRTYEPQCQIMYLWTYVHSKDSDQLAHQPSQGSFVCFLII